MGYIGMCGPKGYGFSAILVINWVSILAILHGIDFCTLVFNLVFLLEEATSSSRRPSPIRALPSSTPLNACHARLRLGRLSQQQKTFP